MTSRPTRRPTQADLDNPHPLYAVWEITLACDLGCKHCGSRAGKARPDELTTEQCLKVVSDLADLGVREVTLIGGEFYLREDWDTIARAVTDHGMTCSVTTGAKGLTAERVARAEAAGIAGVSVSIDGLEGTHDAMRGPRGSWAAAMAAIERVSASSMHCMVNTQVNRLSMPELPALADLLIERGVRSWRLQLTTPMGRAADRPDLLLQPFELLELFPLLAWIKQTKLDPQNVRLAAGNNLGYHSPYGAIVRSGAQFSGCAAGKYTLGLEADGKIKGCPSLPSSPYTGGYLGRDDLAVVVATAPELRALRDRTREDLWGFCATCEHADTCMGGCSWMTHTLLGRPGNNPYCIHRALQLEARGVRERVAKATQASGLPFDHAIFEIIEEPWPEEEAAPSILGVLLGEVQSLSSQSQSMWTQDVIRSRLQRS